MPASPVLARYGLRAVLIAAILSTAAPVSARNGRNAALIGGAAAGVVGGLALGALMNGGAPPPPPRPRPIYVEDAPPPVYVRRPPPGPICHYERRKVWLDEYEFTYKRVEVCE